MNPSQLKHREILRHFYALVGIVVVSVTLVAISVSVSQTGEQRLRERLERFHLRSAMLTFEASSRASGLQQEILVRPVPGEPDPRARLASRRAIRSAVYSMGQAMDSIIELHRDWQQPIDPFSKTVGRAARHYRDLKDVASREPRVTADLTTAVAAFEFTLFQLERLHTISAGQVLDRIAITGRRNTRRATAAVGLVLLVAGMLVVRILFLLRARLRVHEQTEQALLERERQLQQASKMEALGSLVGGVAHDFNNLLTAILGNTESLQQQIDPADPRQRALQQVRKAGERAAGLTRQLLAFSRQQAVDLRVVDLNLLIRDVEPMLRRLIRADIALVLRLDAEACNVEVDPVQMEQVLINLAVNARDAMGDGGVLTVLTSNARIAAADPEHATMRPGDYVRIGVEDTGCGMTPETMSRVFDPFFTTKEQGKGTGLGLSTVHGIVTRGGGQVLVQSETGAGTRFEVFLPRSDKPAIDHPAVAEGGPVARGSETVLVAEDDRQVRALTVDGLRGAGYQVLEASDGIEALRLCSEHGGPIHLILSDVVMPGMRGPEMVERALALHPGARVLYVSGYAEEEVFQGVSVPGPPLLTKPFKLQQLLTSVRRELNAPRVEDAKAGSPA